MASDGMHMAYEEVLQEEEALVHQIADLQYELAGVLMRKSQLVASIGRQLASQHMDGIFQQLRQPRGKPN